MMIQIEKIKSCYQTDLPLMNVSNGGKNPNCTEICRRFIADYNDYSIIPNSISVDNNEKGKVSENAEYIIQYAKDYFKHK